MISAKLRKFAQLQGLQMEYSRVYGSLHGYCMTLTEEDRYLSLMLTTRFTDTEKLDALREYLQSRPFDKDYDVRAIDLRSDRIRVIFARRSGRIRTLEKFLPRFVAVLEEYGACKDHICPCCGKVLGQGTWKLVRGVAYCVHEDCVPQLQSSIKRPRVSVPREGSYATGSLGAAAGAMIGAAIWAFVMTQGLMASLVGFLTGLLVDRGYELCRGKNGKNRIYILCASVFLGIFAGQLIGDVFLVIRDLKAYGWNLSFMESLRTLLRTLGEDASSLRVFVLNVFLGLMFALVGAIGLKLREESREVVPDYADLSYPMVKISRG